MGVGGHGTALALVRVHRLLRWNAGWSMAAKRREERQHQHVTTQQQHRVLQRKAKGTESRGLTEGAGEGKQRTKGRGSDSERRGGKAMQLAALPALLCTAGSGLSVPNMGQARRGGEATAKEREIDAALCLAQQSRASLCPTWGKRG